MAPLSSDVSEGDRRRHRIVVVGGGISGLAAAHRLTQLRPDAEVVVLEASEEIGGKLRRTEVGGSWVDVGAEAMLARRPEGVALAEEIGLASELVQPLTSAALLRNRQRNLALPPRTLMGIPTDLEVLRAGDVLSNESLDRIAAEGRQREFPAVTEDISVGELVEQRFGAEVVQRLVDPLLGGVYAGRAEHISVRAALPGLARQLTQLGGSLLHAARAIVAGAAREDDPRPVFRSVSGGLARLAEKLAELGEFTIRRNTTVRLIERTPDGYRLCLGAASSGEQLTADAVIVAVPAGKAAVMLHDIAPVAARELSGIETASVVIVTLALPMQAVAGLPSGSGILVPAIENTQIKAMTFSSQKWPDVGAESGVFLLRGSLGRAGEERALQYEDSELVSVLRHELVQITGVTANPIDSHVQRWGGGLPQYAVGHVERVEKIRALLGSLPGIAVCGASYEGVGIPACIDSAYRAADRVLTDLSADGE